MSVRGSFDNGLYIYDPSKVDGWVTAKSCVWHGPKFLSSVSVLETHYSGDHSLEHFFPENPGRQRLNDRHSS
jgi:hypothetical protein